VTGARLPRLTRIGLHRLSQFSRSSLRVRMLILFAGLLGGMLAVSLLVASSGLSMFARTAAERDMAANARVFEEVIRLRVGNLRDASTVVARDFGFRKAIAAGDRPTIGSALDSLAGRTGVDTAAVVLLDGTVIAGDGMRPPAGDRLVAALDSGRSHGIVRAGRGLALAVAAPIEMPDVVGWLLLVQPMERSDLAALGKLSAVPITARIVERRAAAADGAIAVVDGPRGEVLTRLSPLPSLEDGLAPRLLLEHPLERALASYRLLDLALLSIAAVVAVVGAWLALRLSESVTRPLQSLVEATKRVAAGQVTRVAVTGGDEVALLAASFNSMVAAIDDRERRITHASLHDGLTGLPNRRFFIERLDRALARRTASARTLVAFFDLDDFKAINDTYGHPAGDALLRHAGAAVQAAFPDAVVARFGGDEFAMLLDSVPPLADAAQIAARLHEALNAETHVDGRTIPLSASIGIAIGPDDGDDGDALLKNADLALYRAKSEGKGAYHFFEASLDEKARQRRLLEIDLRQAIRDTGFELYFQPLFCLSQNRCKGFEALLRWRHPERGFVSPADFIPLAEDTGLIVPLGEWVIAEACRQAAGWPSDVSVAVNVSPRQFASPNFEEVVLAALAASGLAPARLELEITESIFIGNVERTLASLHALRARGVRLALDDFGTGYSSLSYLRSFPFDKLKIDQSFVRSLDADPAGQAIVRAITTLASALGIETLAEGVETAAHLAILREENCDLIQGYLISRPVPASEVRALIDSAGVPAPRLRSAA